MTSTRSLCLLALLAMLWSPPSQALVPPLSPPELLRKAHFVVTGTIVSIYERSVSVAEGTNREYVASVAVQGVDQGAGLGPGDLLYVHYWRAEQRPAGWVGDFGQSDLPRAGQKVRLYLTRRFKFYQLLNPNGWRPL